jgi:hypothetical protein
VKALQLAIIASVVLLGNACSLWPKQEPEMSAIDFLSTPTNAFQKDLQSAQQREVFAATRTATAREAYEKLKKDFKEAGDKTKPATAVQLATAQGDYISAQEWHMESKRSLRQAKDAYLYKLYVNKHPEAVEAPALDITAEAGLPAAMATPAATGAPPVEITAKPQTPAEEGTAEAGPTERFDGNFQ